MTRTDTSRQHQLAARLKAAIGTAAIVGALGGWIAFGNQQSVATVTTSSAPVAVVSAPVATSSNTIPTVAQAAQNTGVTAATYSPAAAAPATSSEATTQNSTTASSSASSSAPTSRRGAVTTTRSSR